MHPAVEPGMPDWENRSESAAKSETRKIEPPVWPVTRGRSRRVAMVLNLFLPGAGQIYLGQSVIGGILAVGFMACFVAMMAIFVRGYAGYLQMCVGGDILQAGNLETLSQLFHPGRLGALSVAAIGIYLASAIHLSRSRLR
jgi:hypothetical protein